MAIQTEPTRIQIPFADSGTKNVIPDTNSTPSASQAASWTDGFPAQCSLPLSAGGIPPARADFNGILNTMTQSIRYGQEGGVWTWDATVDYGTSRVVLGSDGKLYWAVAQSGPNLGGAQDPTTDNGTYWQAMPMDDANVVHKTGNEIIQGRKTFYKSTGFHTVDLISGSFDVDNAPSSDLNTSFGISDKNEYPVATFGAKIFTDGDHAAYINSYINSTNPPESLYFHGVSKKFFPSSNGTISLGSSGHKWGQIYSSSGTINTSDARLKSLIATIPDEVLDAWHSVSFVQFKFNESIEKKGDSARLHSGLIAQDIDKIFKDAGLDASVYGLFCWDSWEAEPEMRDESGVIHSKACPAGEGYSLRYDEALCMEAAYQRRRADRAEARLAAIEERLASIEAKLG